MYIYQILDMCYNALYSRMFWAMPDEFQAYDRLLEDIANTTIYCNTQSN